LSQLMSKVTVRSCSYCIKCSMCPHWCCELEIGTFQFWHSVHFVFDWEQTDKQSNGRTCNAAYMLKYDSAEIRRIKKKR